MTCCLCSAKNTELLIDFGLQPVCNRFTSCSDVKQARIPLAIEQCQTCGLLQLEQPGSERIIIPEIDWIIYNEAEGHLDETVDQLLSTTNLGPGAHILGISYKDETTVARIAAKGVTNTHVLDPVKDLDISSPCAGIETIQAQLTPERAAHLREVYGPVDILIVRHILEHVHHPQVFMQAMKLLLKKNGTILLEVPDFSTALIAHDYTYIWEEHVSYYTSEMFKRAMPILGLSPERFMTFDYPLEKALLCIARPAAEQHPKPPPPSQSEIEAALAYKQDFPIMKKRIQQFLAARTAAGRKTAIFGAGHLACKFVNLFEIKNHICFVADDDSNKKGRHMAGSNLPILGSAELVRRQIDLCLFSLSPESEIKVRASQKSYFAGGGKFASISPAVTSCFLNTIIPEGKST